MRLTTNNLVQAYAEAIFAIAKEKKEISVVYEQFKEIKKIFEDQILFNFFCSGPCSYHQKVKIISKILSKTVRYFRYFLFILLSKNKFSLLFLIYLKYQNYYNIERNIGYAIIWSKYLLSPKTMNEMKIFLAKKYQRKFFLKNKIDGSIIGGFRISYEDYTIDYTLTNYLNDLREQLMKV